MTSRKHSVKVTIVGEEYALRSDASPEHTRAVASYVDAAVRKVMQSGSVVESHKAAVLAALQITDELFRANETLEELTVGVREATREVRRMLPPTRRDADDAA